MNIFSFANNSQNNYLSLDFGSSAIKGLIFEKQQGKIIVKKCGFEEIEKFGVFSTRDFPMDIVKIALKKLILSLNPQSNKQKLKTIICLPPSIFETIVISISLSRKNEEERISKEEEEEIKEKIIHLAGRKLFQIIKKKFGNDPSVFQILKTRVLETKISGYKVPCLTGYRGKKTEFKVLLVYGLIANLNFIHDLVKEFNFGDFSVCHEVEGLITARKFLGPGRVYASVGSDTTQLYLFNNILESTKIIPMGGRDFSEKICDLLGISHSQSEQLKISFSKGEMSGESLEKIKKAFSPIYLNWFNEVQEELKAKNKLVSSNSEIILFGGASGLFQEKCYSFIQNSPVEETTKITADKIKAKLLDISKLPIENKSGAILSERHIPILLSAFYDF